MTTGTPSLRIAVLDDYQGVAARLGPWSSIPDAELTAFADHLDDVDALAERLAPFDVVCLMRERTRMPAGLLSRLPKLKLIVTAGMWNASLDVGHAVRQGIAVCGTTSLQSGTPELTWLLLLALARRLPAELASVAAGGWQTAVGDELEGRVLGVLGLGTIGSKVARVANAFGMRVLAWSENLTAERAAEAGASLVSKDELLRSSDYVTVHMKLSPRTRGLIGAREFGLMKRSAFLVNTSRGPIVSEPALIDALQSGRIAGVGLDVFDVEPLPPDHPLRSLPHVIATPHIGYVTERNYAHFYAQFVEDILAWIAKAPVRVLDADRSSLQTV
ncbi:D-2-hydroxyacid dehydrogenase family protein [Variovorax sp. PBL-E5]|uniref:D-2-hydroxyacid dehydrogenase family protein n=1 Tax=Variovorax sp. PBL-E5 TaxID=434014 RepID=UPI001316F637|nr:D-2-hydroxyacid dehydrogenase family protein [Variovorax sp. PBL-E5]VTU19738.1 Putative 2-hydroxyacid dehydrogenase [Variovorax sp. PBL-E5]